MRCALGRRESASPWGGATGDRDHPFIRLRHTGRAHPARFKGDAHLQGCAAGASSTCHAGLLAPGTRGVRGTARAEEVPPEIRHHTQVAVVFVECSSKTLPACWQLCRKLSLSRLNHWLPRGQTHPEVVQGTAEFHHQIADTLLPQTNAVLHDTTALDTAVDMLDP